MIVKNNKMHINVCILPEVIFLCCYFSYELIICILNFFPKSIVQVTSISHFNKDLIYTLINSCFWEGSWSDPHVVIDQHKAWLPDFVCVMINLMYQAFLVSRSVISMSLGGFFKPHQHNAVKNLITVLGLWYWLCDWYTLKESKGSNVLPGKGWWSPPIKLSTHCCCRKGAQKITQV